MTIAEPGLGCARLHIERVAGECAAVSTYSTNPMKLIVPRARGRSVWAYASSFGGGLVAGDETSLDLELGSQACCFLGTQASTKIYRNPDGRACSHQTRASLASGSMLVFAPDPVQPFADSSYRQSQQFDLAADANLVLIDSFSSGRRARGERWAFNHYSSRIEIRVGDRLIFLDALRLDPADGALEAAHRGGRYHCLSTLVAIGPAWAPLRTDLLEHINATPVTRASPVLCSASPLPGGVVLRLAGEAMEPVLELTQRYLNRCEKWLGDNPWLRKW